MAHPGPDPAHLTAPERGLATSPTSSPAPNPCALHHGETWTHGQVGVIGVGGATAAMTGTVIASASGWSSPTGLAAFITALVGAGAFVWSIVSAVSKKKQIDLDSAREFVKLMKEAEDDEA